MNDTPKRIKYDFWANSHLSIAKYYGGITYSGKHYVLDYENCPTTGEGDDKKYFPDLVLESELKKIKSR